MSSARGGPAAADALTRLPPLLRPVGRTVAARPAASKGGYLDLLGPAEAAVTGPAQRLMLTSAVPFVYERWWRPALGRIAKGARGVSMADEHRIARLLLGLAPGEKVLDVACGPGNFTRGFGRTVGLAGLSVGIDASTTMLARAVRDTPEAERQSVAYVRGDAVALPFLEESFDAVCCFAALHLFPDPMLALDHMTGVLRSGGRIAILTSCRARAAPLRGWDGLLGARSGMRMFDREEVVAALRERGFDQLRQRVGGLTQIVGGWLG